VGGIPLLDELRHHELNKSIGEKKLRTAVDIVKKRLRKIILRFSGFFKTAELIPRLHQSCQLTAGTFPCSGRGGCVLTAGRECAEKEQCGHKQKRDGKTVYAMCSGHCIIHRLCFFSVIRPPWNILFQS
jgi:hypothetical protein